jgi:hypothetical protein
MILPVLACAASLRLTTAAYHDRRVSTYISRRMTNLWAVDVSRYQPLVPHPVVDTDPVILGRRVSSTVDHDRRP